MQNTMVCRLAHAAIAFWCILQAIGEFEVSLKQRKGTLANLHSPQENQHPPSKGYIISLRDDTTHDEVTELRRELWQRTGRQGNVNDDPTKVEIWEVLTKGISITLDQQTLQWVSMYHCSSILATYLHIFKISECLSIISLVPNWELLVENVLGIP